MMKINNSVRLCIVTLGLVISLTSLAAISEKQCVVAASGKTYPCQVGKSGIVADKHEGDGATPAGRFLIREIFYRPDKLSAQQIARLVALQSKGFAVRALTTDDGWSDDIKSPQYNQHISIAKYTRVPNLSYEKLWRDDEVYNIVAVLGYNDRPVIKGKGSAIFMHVMREADGKGLPTVGCISLRIDDLINTLTALTPQSRITTAVDSPRILIGKKKG